ncbi:MAG: 3-deoxy-7-phosphoheptulonate synthase [Gammaproteobacteria bacterium]
MLHITDDLRITGLRPLLAPAILMEELPVTEAASTLVAETRARASDIIAGKDDRLLAVVGPCSIHDIEAATEYAEHLAGAIQQHSKELLIIMRVYFEKPRTTVGWKGLINDPHLDNSFDINTGLHLARKLLLDLNDRGVPAGSEFLDTITPQYIADLISWGAIGARTTESQVHRELASGMSMPIGFKNGTDGNIQIAIDAIGAAQHPHQFLSVTKQGISAIVETRGNDACHIILRGSTNGPNYAADAINETRRKLHAAPVNDRIMVDCSHGNSSKDYKKQPVVLKDISTQISNGSEAIFGVMIESHLQAGNQPHNGKTKLIYGKSITDACVSWEMTEPMLEQLAVAVRARRGRK